MHLVAHAEMTPSGVPPIPHSRSTGERSETASSAPETSPSVIRRTRAPAPRMASMPSWWRSRFEHDGGDVADLDPTALGDQADGLPQVAVEVEQVGDLLAPRHLLHVDARAGVEHRPLLGQRDHGQRARHAQRAQARALERVDGDVDLRLRAVADVLAVVQHRRLVLLPLADHDDAVHADRRKHGVHAVHGGLVGGDLVAAADPARGLQRRGFGHPDQFEGQVAIGYQGHLQHSGWLATALGLGGADRAAAGDRQRSEEGEEPADRQADLAARLARALDDAVPEQQGDWRSGR